MQDQLDVMKEIISSFLLDGKEGKSSRNGFSAQSWRRQGYRNGSRKRSLKTTDGKLELKKP